MPRGHSQTSAHTHSTAAASWSGHPTTIAATLTRTRTGCWAAQVMMEGEHELVDEGVPQKMRAWRIGQWTAPCRHSQPECHRDLAVRALQGMSLLQDVFAYHRRVCFRPKKPQYRGSGSLDSLSACQLSAKLPTEAPADRRCLRRLSPVAGAFEGSYKAPLQILRVVERFQRSSDHA